MGDMIERDPATSTYNYREDTNWDDLRFPLTGQQLTTPAGRVDFDFTNVGVDFNSNALYPSDFVVIVAQMPHSKKFGTPVKPHIHWMQDENKVPNMVLAHRWYKNGQLIPSAWKLSILESHVFSYVSGNLAQISAFPEIIPPIDESVSSILEMKLYRDSNNSSTLFAGADPFTNGTVIKELDLHYQIGSVGSGEEYYK